MSKVLAPDDAHSVWFFYNFGAGIRPTPTLPELIQRMLVFKGDNETPEQIQAACEIFMSDVEHYTQMAQDYDVVYEAKKVQDEAEKDRLKKEKTEKFIRDRLPSGTALDAMVAAIPLSADEIVQVAEALLRTSDENIEHLQSLKKPAQLHLFMLNYNWDAGTKAVQWIAASPQCDKGTALICAWRTDLVSDVFQDTEFRRKNAEESAIVLDVHTRCLAGHYGEAFVFDPRNDRGHSWVSRRDCPGMEPSFAEPSPGKSYDWPFLEA